MNGLGAVLALALLLATSSAQATETVAVAPGASAVLAGSTDPITEPHARLGAAQVVTDSAVPKPNNMLVYVAPAGDLRVSDSVSFKVNGVQQTQAVDVGDTAPLLSSGDTYNASFKALFELLIVAVLLESGLALIFNWKPFLTVFDPKAINALISFGLSFAFVVIFRFDIVGQLLNIYAGLRPTGSDWPGIVVTAMIIAGGSASVNHLFQSLGLRAPLAQSLPEPQKPPPNVAWIAVTPVRKRAVGDVTVLLQSTTGGAQTTAALATIPVARTTRRWLAFILRNRSRFPASGGHSLPPGDYAVSLAGYDDNGAAIVSMRTWGPYTIAAGSIIDISLEI